MISTVIQKARAILAAGAVDPSISKQDTIAALTALLAAPAEPCPVHNALVDLTGALRPAHYTDFGGVQIDRDDAADFWIAFDEAKQILSKVPA